MILQELVKYYDRKSSEDDFPRPGFFYQKIRFEIIIDKKGSLIDIIDLVDEDGNTSYRLSPIVPDRSRDAESVSGFLIDKAEYIFGSNKILNKPKYAETFLRMTETAQSVINSSEIAAVVAFLKNVKKINFSKELKEKILTKQGPYFTFRIDGTRNYIYEEPSIMKWIETEYSNILSRDSKDQNVEAQCLISGVENSKIARIHQQIKSGWLGDKNASIINFNDDAYTSYNKDQSYNAPVSIESESKYSNALKYLIYPGSQYKIRLGDLVILFWSSEKSNIEDSFLSLFTDDNTASKNIEMQDAESLKSSYRAPFSGKQNKNDANKKFYILGLSANASRISIRFWQENRIKDILENINSYFNDLELEVTRYEKNPNISIKQILTSTAFQSKMDRVNPALHSKLVLAIINGSGFPRLLLSGILNRIKAERNPNFVRISVIKAILNRKGRNENFKNYPEVKISMDENNQNIAYRLGRLFAVMEMLQKQAINVTTIKDSYYTSASTRPATVFPKLFALSNHHSSKLGPSGIFFEKLKGEILEPVSASIPRTFNLEEQGLFAVGYYQQKNDLYKKKEVNEPNDGEETNE
jgi:CRISPR-associated protein Csd1